MHISQRYGLFVAIVLLTVLLGQSIPGLCAEVAPESNVSEYNYLPTGKEPLGLAGPLPASGWAPPADDVLNVRELGAKGDGVTDDTKVLQEIFKNVDHGQVILFPAGKYVISDTLRLDYRFGVSIVMHGGFRSNNLRTADCRGLFWASSGPQDRPMILVYNCSQIVFAGLKLDGGGRAQDGLILDAESSSSGFRGDNVHIRSCARYGLRIATWRENHPVGGPQVDVMAFRNSKFTNCGSKQGTDDAQVTVESAQALIILFDTCEFGAPDDGEYNVYIRGGRPQFVNACFLSGRNTRADIFIGNNYTAGVNVYMAHSEGANPGRYFLHVNRPEPGGVGWVILEGIGASGKVLFNASHSIEISNSQLCDIDIPCPQARVVLSNVTVFGKVSLGTKAATSTNVVIVDRGQ